MTTIVLPDSMRRSAMEWGVQKSGMQFQSPYNGTLQAVEFAAERWLLSLTLATTSWSDAGGVEALVSQLAGGVNRLRVYKLTRPQPAGTMRGTPVLTSAAARGDLVLHVTTDPGVTLTAGDMFSSGGQLFQASGPCVADGAGHLVVPLVTRVRKATPDGTPVVWDRPTADFVFPALAARYAYSTGILNGPVLDGVEVWD